MSLQDRLQADLVDAMKAKREPDRTVLRSLQAALQNARIESGDDLDDAGEAKVIAKQLKQREEAIAAATERPELAERERAEAEIIKRYLPEQMSEADVDAAVAAAIKETGAQGPSDIGKVMGALKAKTAGRADQAAVAALVKKRLNA